ncbi:MAG: TRAP transporter small permease [Gammaproteobacteria bacterium]|nr:TRAP transporter small permease [Gammaproteobacteria bacterium]
MKFIEAPIKWLSFVLMLIGGAAMLLMMVQITADVFMKHFFDQPITGTLEVVSFYYMTGIIFLPFAYIQLKRGHIVVELIAQKMTPKGQLISQCFTDILLLIFLLLYVSSSYEMAVFKMGFDEAVEIAEDDFSIWPARWFLPLGGAIMIVVVILQLLRNLPYLFNGRLPESGIS